MQRYKKIKNTALKNVVFFAIIFFTRLNLNKGVPAEFIRFCACLDAA